MTDRPRSDAQRAASRANGSASRGPTSPEGRARAALNSIRHGLAAKHLLLGGEDQARYEAHVESWFVALGPEDDAHAEIAALLGDAVPVPLGQPLGRPHPRRGSMSRCEKRKAGAAL
jgi:hypothetical protein